MDKTLTVDYLKLVPEATGYEEKADGSIVFYDDEGAALTSPSQAIINEERVRGEEYIASIQYASDRAVEYPAIGDQLDALFHAGVFPAEMASQIQAIKDKHPKGV